MDLIPESVTATLCRIETVPQAQVYELPEMDVSFAQLLMLTKDQIPKKSVQLDYAGTFTIDFHIDAAKDGSLFLQNLLEDIINVSIGVLSIRKRQDLRRHMQCVIEEKTTDYVSNVHTIRVNIYTDAPDRLYRALDCIKIKQ